MIITQSLKSEISWFLTGFAGVLLAGVIVSWPVTCVLLYSLGYVAWLLHRLNSIMSWLDQGAKPQQAPPTVGLCSDIVQLIHREKKYSRKQKNRYRSALAQFNSLAAELPDATIALNDDNEIRWSNAAAQKLLNIHPDRDKGQRVDNLVRLPSFRKFLHNDTFEGELEIPGPTSPDRVLAIRKVPTNKHMKVIIAADITQRVQVREMRKAFVGDVSHELRTPLTVIRGYVEMLQEDESLEPEAKLCVQQISTQSERMGGIVEDLLQLSKLEGNPLADDEGDTVNMATLIKSMVGALETVATKHEFVLNLDNNLALRGSETEIYCACNNLLTNAVRHTDLGTRITVSWKTDAEGTAVYTVTDNGLGIEARHLSRLSERFYRVDSGRSRESGGTGLGLAIVKHAAHRHGGGLNISSTPGQGSEFEITFPAIRVVESKKLTNQ